MHHSCVKSTTPGGRQPCPICKTEMKLEEELETQDFPLWHQAEVGAPGRKGGAAQIQPQPERVGRAPLGSHCGPSSARSSNEPFVVRKETTYNVPSKPPFPLARRPTEEEMKFHGYATLVDWYVDARREEERRNVPGVSAEECEKSIGRFKAEFVELQNRWAAKEDAEEEAGDEDAVDALRICTDQTDRTWTLEDSCRVLGSAETGPALSTPSRFADVGPLAWNRALNHSAAKELLSKTLKTKWEEATTGPPKALKKESEGCDE